MQDEEKTNGSNGSEQSVPIPDVGALFDIEVTPEESEEQTMGFINPAFILLFISFAVVAFVYCLPSILGSSVQTTEVHGANPNQTEALKDNRDAQKALKQTVGEIESALQDPQRR